MILVKIDEWFANREFLFDVLTKGITFAVVFVPVILFVIIILYEVVK